MDKDILIFIAITIAILVGGGIIIHQLLKNSFIECASDPLVYGAEKYEKDYGKETYGNFYIGRDRYFFNSSVVTAASLI